MPEIRLSFRPSEMRLIRGALTAVRKRAVFMLTPPPQLGASDKCIYEYAVSEIDALLKRLPEPEAK